MKKDNNVIENFPLFRPVHCSTPVVIKNPKVQQYLNSGYKVYDRENKIFVSFNDVVSFIRPACYSVFEYLDSNAMAIPHNVFIKDYSNISLYNNDTDYLVCDKYTSSYFKGIKRYYYKYTNSIEYLCTRYYFVDSLNRVVDQCFIAVSCNKCLICNRKKINNISQMCMFQTEECKFLPFFVTLTYNNYRYIKRSFDFKHTYYKVVNNEEKKISENLSLSPLLAVESLKVSQYKDGSLLRSFVVNELQRFLKRLRIGLKRAGLDVKLKYYFVSEIGKKGRLHYQGLMWLCPETPSEVLNKLYAYNLLCKTKTNLNQQQKKLKKIFFQFFL